MSITVISHSANPTIPPTLAVGGLAILSGVIECVFKGDDSGDVVRATVDFTVGRVNLSGLDVPTASCIMSPASIAFDGPVSNALWAVDSARVPAFLNVDRGRYRLR